MLGGGLPHGQTQLLILILIPFPSEKITIKIRSKKGTEAFVNQASL